MNKAERGSPPPSSPSSSKLPKFLQKQSRDRSKSMVDHLQSTSSSSSTIASSSASSSPSPIPESPKSNHSRHLVRNSSKKLFGSKEDKRRQSQDIITTSESAMLDHPPSAYHHTERRQEDDFQGEETPVIVEPVAIPRPRTRSERPLSENYPSVNFYPSSSNSRLTDFPSRLSGWFSHTFSTSSTDLSLPSLLSQQHIASTASPSKGKSSALLTAAKHGKGHLDKAMRYLLDSDAMPDKCSDPIWILGVEHPGYEPGAPLVLHATPNSGGRRSSSIDSRRSPSAHRSASSSPIHSPTLSQSQPPSSSPSSSAKDPGRNWPPVFYADFTSRIWLTYRSQFSPIRDISLEELTMDNNEANMMTAGSPQPKKWNWPLGGEKGWSSDAGWGCMLRTGQSLLANALLHLHLGRDWRRPPYPVHTADYATYVQILTWFLDDPSSLCPFSVHRMALVGKQLGVRVGQWFGPSTAAGAIKTLVHAFPEAELGVYVAADGGTIYESEVLAASHTSFGSPRRGSRKVWGDRAVLVLIGHRLGIDGVNPVYYDTLKNLYTWPQSVGIAGGRPSSSYYFVGSQADNLFYLDPHHARPTVPLRPPPHTGTGGNINVPPLSPTSTSHRHISPEPAYSSDRERDRHPRTPHRQHQHMRAPTSPASVRSSSNSVSSSTFSHRHPKSPSPLQQQISTSSTSSNNTHSPSSSSQSHARWRSSSVLHDRPSAAFDMDSRELGVTSREGGLGSLGDGGDGGDLDPIQRHYATAYSAAELKTFHCERVRKMPLSGLDPSMLMGFLLKDENDWIDFKNRITEMNRKHKAVVLSLQDEPPNWPSDSEMGLESISEPDIDMPDDDEGLLDDNDHEYDDEEEEGSSSEMGRSRSASVSSPGTSVSVQEGHHHGSSGSARPRASTSSKSEADTEEDPIDPITPGAGRTTFEINIEPPPPSSLKVGRSMSGGEGGEEIGTSLDFEDEDDEEWVDPSSEFPPSPTWNSAPEQQPQQVQPPSQRGIRAPPMVESYSTSSTVSRESSESGYSQLHSPPKERRKAKKSTSSSGHTVTTTTTTKSPSSSHRHHHRHHPIQQQQQQQQQQYPFPATYPGEDDVNSKGNGGSGFVSPSGNGSGGKRVPQMRTAKARDGGRTQSGGVRGVPTDDGDDF